MFIENPAEFDLGKKYKLEEWKPKPYKPFEVRDDEVKLTKLKKWNDLKDIQFKENEIITEEIDGEEYLNQLKNNSFCCSGMPGCQKTTLLKRMYVPGETIVLCFTNKACQNILKDLGQSASVHTFDSKFFKQEDSETIFKNTKRILIDEFSMIPLKWMNKLYQLKKGNDIILQFYGDPDQCTPVDIRYFDYMKKKAFREM